MRIIELGNSMNIEEIVNKILKIYEKSGNKFKNKIVIIQL